MKGLASTVPGEPLLPVASVTVDDEGPYVVVMYEVPALGEPYTTAPDTVPLACVVLV